MQQTPPSFATLAGMELFAFSCFALLLFIWKSFGGPSPLEVLSLFTGLTQPYSVTVPTLAGALNVNPNDDDDCGEAWVASPAMPSSPTVVTREALPAPSVPLDAEALNPNRVAEPLALMPKPVLEPGATAVAPLMLALIEKLPPT